MSNNVVIVDDLVSGIVGTFVRKEPAPGKENRVVIYYKKPSITQFFEKVQKIPANIPIDGIVEVPGVKCEDGIGRIIIFSYGDDLTHPPIIKDLIDVRIGDTIQALEKAKKELSLKSNVLEAKERTISRNLDEEVKKRMENQKQPSPLDRFNLRPKF